MAFSKFPFASYMKRETFTTLTSLLNTFSADLEGKESKSYAYYLLMNIVKAQLLALQACRLSLIDLLDEAEATYFKEAFRNSISASA